MVKKIASEIWKVAPTTTENKGILKYFESQSFN